MAKAARVLAGLKRDGWIEIRRSGSHRVLVKGDQQRIWAYHDGVDLGGPALARLAPDYGYSIHELRKLYGDLAMSVLRVELLYDQEASNWHYRVPALHINGGGTPTRADAEQECLSSIAFALEGNPEDYDPAAEAITLDVKVAPAA
jgi:predicted RNA binding protein YcfA (HicA-like mRNA interferase family)